MEPFDAGRDHSSARLDQMRSRAVPVAPRPQRAVFAWMLVAALLAFALGLIANPWFERSVRSHLPGFAATVVPTVGDLTALDARIAALEARPRAVAAAGAIDPVIVGTGAGGERLARIEGTVATLGATVPAANARAGKLATDLAALTGRIDAGAAATAAALATATASADRAQAMLVTGAVRRQLTEGARLGALEPALRRSFGPTAASAVEAVAALGANPVTLSGLRAELDRLRPALGTGAAAASPDWWTGFRDGFAGLVVRPMTPKVSPIDRAATALAAGNVAAASAEIAALPAVQRATLQGWMAAADRYLAGWRAMAVLETTLLNPPVPTLN